MDKESVLTEQELEELKRLVDRARQLAEQDAFDQQRQRMRDKRDKRIVIAFGRFNPPTIGHAHLIDFVRKEAAKRQADMMIFPSQTHDIVTMRTRVAPKNPLPFLEKVDFLEEMFPGVDFSSDVRIKTPIDAVAACSMAGYDRVWAVVGSDRAADFAAFAKFIKPSGVRGQDIILKEFGVISVPGNRDPDAEGVAGMSASKMRAAALENDFEAFRKGVPTNRIDIAQKLFRSVQKHMGLRESSQRGFLLYGPQSAQLSEAVTEYTTMRNLTPRDVTLHSPRFAKQLACKLPFAIDVRNESFVNIRHLHGLLESVGVTPTVYVYDRRGRVVSEDTVLRMTTSGLIKRGLARDVVCVLTAEQMIEHMVGLMEAAGGEGKGATEVGLKAPSEVDRLKATQKQQDLMTKQRQAQELLAAKQRELAKKTRDAMNKIKTGEKPTSSAK